MLRFLIVFSFAVSAYLITSDPVWAIDIRSNVCRASFKKFQSDIGYKAFALSKNKRHCGRSFYHPSKRSAAKRALSECRKVAHDCAIAQESLKLGVGTEFCKKSLRNFRKRQGYKAFAVSSSGGCGFAWDRRSQHDAIRGALSNCRKDKSRPTCFIFKQ